MNGFEKSRSHINLIYLKEDLITKEQMSISPNHTKYIKSELRSQIKKLQK